MSASKVAAPDTITDMPSAMLVSATYDAPSKSAVLKFYEPSSQNIILWKDATGHKPYCYSILSPDEIRAELGPRSDVLAIESTTRRDLAEDKEITVSKIVVDDPLAIGGTAGSKSIRNVLADTWESDIKYYENYLYDRSLIVGKHYTIQDSQVRPEDQEISEDVRLALKSLIWDKITDEEMADTAQFQEFISEWAHLLNQPIPEIRRVAIDIEVEAEEGRVPDPKMAENLVTAVGFDGTDNLKQVFVLDTGIQKGTNELDPDVRVKFYSDEKQMIQDTFRIISDASFVLTYNGDEFDLPYLYNRARRLGIPDEDNPLYMMRNSATLRRGVHIDLYRTMSNRSFQIYAFSQKYTSFSLNSVSEALLGERKIDYGKALGELTLYETANYCYNDARLTLKLTTFNNDLLMNLLVIIARIGRMPVDDIARMGVSQWIRSLLYYEHRRMNALIPRQKELSKRTPDEVAAEAVIKDKKFRGGLVIEPVGGVHFDVTVMDFASLYPSIIKVRNLSYETVRCSHTECRANKIPQTNHWVCSRKNGITAMIIGSLRDLRVNYYKALSKSPTLTEEERQQYVVVTQALKVILNASYGVMGAEVFPLYFLPAAETTTAIGRHIIQGTTKMCEDAGVKVLYGDSVMPDTPVCVEKEGMRCIVPIQSLVAETHYYGRYKLKTHKIFSDGGMVPVQYYYKHKVKKRGYGILTRTAYVEVTEDHSLMIDGRETSPKDLKVGDELNATTTLGMFTNDVEMDTEMAWVLGLYIAEGSLGRNSWKISNKDASLLERVRKTLERVGIMAKINQYKSNGDVLELKAASGAHVLFSYLKHFCYASGHKIVPYTILNGTMEVKRAFFDGMMAGDGHVDKHDGALNIGQKHKSVMAGLLHIMAELGMDYTLKMRRDKPSFINARVVRDIRDPRVGKANVIKKIIPFEIDGYVYDVSTENEHFRGGLGNVLLHNTDSLFVKGPTADQTRGIMESAKREYGVDLEVEKEYRYCVLSNLKKNYFGVTKSGKVDVKGLTGKKSHTPPFIKKLFEEIILVLSQVHSMAEFEQARKEISSKIADSGRRLESREIPVEELAFNMTMSKAPSEYIKTVPQHVRAAKLLESESGREIKRGEIISYIKTRTKLGVKPVSMARTDEVDPSKYLEFMESTLGQVTSPMGLDFEEALGKPKQTGLDQFFWG